ncbi:MAG: TRAP transporter large permease [Burkholderiales bacterium]
MIAVVFLAILVVIMGIAALTGNTSGPLPVAELFVLVALFCLFFGAGVYVAAVLGVLGLIIGFAFSDRPFWLAIGQIIWAPSANFILVAIPLFLLMGEIMLRAGLSEKLYRSLNIFLYRLPGGLLHTNILSCGVFSAVSGSSVATAATMGSVALPYFQNTRYDPRMVLGSLAAGGALGNLIPPGITFILYGLLTDTSVGKLYLAALGPSLLVMLLFMGVIYWHGLTRAGKIAAPPKPPPVSIARIVLDLLPTVLLIGMVLGTIYAGLATPTESAAFGVVGAVVFALIERRLSWKMLNEAAASTARTTAMIGLIVLAAFLLNYILTSIEVPQKLARLVAELPIPPWAIMLIIIGFYIALGTFMEGFSMIITTIPVIFPVVKALGYDPIWFGVIVTMLVEIALISPPDGTVLYVLQGMRSDRGSIADIFWGVVPFLLVYIAAVLVLMGVPEIALWLPRVMDR